MEGEDDSESGENVVLNRASDAVKASFAPVPICVKNLNTDSGIDWEIKVTVNKKHPVKTHAKG